MPDILSEAAARALCNRALRYVAAPAKQVLIVAREEGNTRSAVNGISSVGDIDDTVITLTAEDGERKASLELNQTDDRALAEAGRRLDALLRVAPEDPELVPLLEQQTYQIVDGFFPSTAALDAVQRAQAAAGLVQSAASEGLLAAGYLVHRTGVRAVANSAGLFAYHRSTAVSVTVSVRTAAGDGSGWAGATHNDWSRVTSPQALADRAVEKARRSRGAEAIDPGTYTVVLEPTAVGNLIARIPGALDARAADEGGSPFSRRGGGTRIGEQVVDERVMLYSDPADPDLLESPFTDEGEAVGRTVWIENGVLQRLGYSRFWAARQGRVPVPIAGGLKLAGGTGDAASLIQSVERGLLVTRFWDIRALDPRTMRYTGLTRDGTFLIEDGQVTRPVKNLRFDDSVLGALNRIEAMGAPVRVVTSESGGVGPALVVPPVVVRDFRFSSVSDAV